MNKAIGAALLVAGIVLIIYGANATHAVTSQVSQTLTGTPTNKALWLLVGGSAAVIVGGALIFMPARKL